MQRSSLTFDPPCSENGERYAYEAAVANHRCPQKVISFYESRLRFKADAAKLPPLATAPSAAPLQVGEEGTETTQAAPDETGEAMAGLVEQPGEPVGVQ